MAKGKQQLINESATSEGFSLIEVAVVMAVLSALSSFAIPNIMNTVKLSRIEEAKALMNSSKNFIDIIKFGFGTGLITDNIKEKIKIYRKNNKFIFIAFS